MVSEWQCRITCLVFCDVNRIYDFCTRIGYFVSNSGVLLLKVLVYRRSKLQRTSSFYIKISHRWHVLDTGILCTEKSTYYHCHTHKSFQSHVDTYRSCCHFQRAVYHTPMGRNHYYDFLLLYFCPFRKKGRDPFCK